MMLKLKKGNNLIFIFSLGLLARIISFYLFRDHHLDNEWGILFINYKNFNIIGINFFDGNVITQGIASAGETVLPSIYMPPFYLFFIIFFSFLFTVKYLVNVILLSQIILSIISSYFFLKLLKKFFSEKVSFIGFLIFLFFPINVFASSQISSVTLQVFFLILFLFFFYSFIEKKKIQNVILFSVCSSILLLLRGEFILILFFSYLFILYQTKNFKSVLKSILITLILLSPYIIRNYSIFNEIVITKSFGYNLWKGNNEYSKVSGNELLYDNLMINDLKLIQPDQFYELKKDSIYKKYAIKNILGDPLYYLKLYFKKMMAFVFYENNSSYLTFYKIFYIIPKILIGIISLIGIFIIGLKRNNLLFLSLYYVLNIIVFSSFFILPRYQLGILPIQIALCCVVFEKLFVKIKKNV